MTLVLHDFLPAQMTDGEWAAIADATPGGWINPPLYNSLEPEQPRKWRTVHLRYLERRELIAECRYRVDGMPRLRLNATGLALRDSLTAQPERLAA